MEPFQDITLDSYTPQCKIKSKTANFTLLSIIRIVLILSPKSLRTLWKQVQSRLSMAGGNRMNNEYRGLLYTFRIFQAFKIWEFIWSICWIMNKRWWITINGDWTIKLKGCIFSLSASSAKSWENWKQRRKDHLQFWISRRSIILCRIAVKFKLHTVYWAIELFDQKH